MAEKVAEDSSMFVGPTVEQRLQRLTEAVRNLYYSACWESDRLSEVKEAELWTEVRDAAGFQPGNSPKPLD